MSPAAHASARQATAPAQATLPAFRPLPLKVSVVGQLIKHAEVRTSVDGGAHLVVQVLQAGDALPFVAMFHAHADEADGLRHRAMAMSAGSAVVVLGSVIELGTYEGATVLRLRHVRGIQLVRHADFLTIHDQQEGA